MIAPINKIIDSSLVDGPGNRTAVFFQGCNFNCRYCHNPETINLCVACKKCIEKCPSGALWEQGDKILWDDSKCRQCDRCITECEHNASPKISYLSVEELEKRVLGNMPFIRGVTCSGGECTLYKNYITDLFGRLKRAGLSCLLDSNGSTVDFSKEPELISVTDGVMLDIKAWNREDHAQLTGKDNNLVLENAVFLASILKLTEIRTVIARNHLNNKEIVMKAAKLLQPFLHQSSIRYRLIKFQPFGVRKEFQGLGTPGDEEMEELKCIARNYGFSDVIIT